MRFPFAHACATALILVAGLPAGAQAPAPSASPLPEIGRTRSAPLACTVIRDLVAPSLGAALDADAAFRDARAQVAGSGVQGAFASREALRTLGLIRLGRNVTAMAQDVLTINRALGDPRVAKSQTDPAARELRDALQALYDAENEKLNAISSFVEGQRMAQLSGDDETSRQMQRVTAMDPHRPDRPVPKQLTEAVGMAPSDIDSPHDPVRDVDRVEALERKAAAKIIAAANGCRPATP
jgi:hypothetical protein